MATFESLVRLKQIYEQDISGYILEVVYPYLQTGDFTGSSFNTGALVGIFYPYSQNPSGYITNFQTGQFATSNNLNQTGTNILSYIGATSYPTSNPLGFLNVSGLNQFLATGTFGTAGIQWVDSVTSGVVLQFLPNQSFTIQGPSSEIQLYNTTENPDRNSPYISGFDVWAYNVNCTGINNQPILTSGYVVGTFVPLSKFTRGQAGQGFNYFLLTDSTESTQSLFDAGNNFYFQGRNQTNISWPYIIDLYGTQAPTYGYVSGAPFILGFDLYSNNIEQQGYRVLTTNDISASGIVTSGSMLAMSGYFQTQDNRFTTQITNLNAVTGTFYPNNNPSGYITSLNAGGVVNLIVSGINVSGSITIQTGYGINITTGTGNSIVISTNSTGNFITTNETGNFVTTNETGNFITSNQTGQFYSINNPAGYINAAGIGGVYKIYVTGTPISGNVGITAIGGNQVSLSGNYIVFSGGAGGSAVNTGNLMDLSTYQVASGIKDFRSGIAVSTISGDLNYVGMIDTKGQVAVDWNNRNLSGNWTIASGNFVSGINVSNSLTVSSGYLNLTGAQYPWGLLEVNLAEQAVIIGDSIGSVNNTFINVSDWAETITFNAKNGFIFENPVSPTFTVNGNQVVTADKTGILTGVFYPYHSNPSGYITTGQTGAFGTAVNTGILTGTFYPLTGNPSGFITTGHNSATGQLTGTFYPLYTNPSGYLYNQPSQSITTNINWAGQTNFYTTLTSNTTFSFSNAVDGLSINVLVRSTGLNTFSVTWPSTVAWPLQITPVQSTGSATDIYTFVNFTGTVFGNVVQGF